MKCSIIDFFKSGKFGDVCFGDSKEKVLLALGEPEHWEGKGTWTVKESDVWAYGPLQVVFEEEVLVKMSYHFPSPFEEETTSNSNPFTDFPWSHSVTEKEVVVFLERNGVDFGSFGEQSQERHLILLPPQTLVAFCQKLNFEESEKKHQPIHTKERFLAFAMTGKINMKDWE